MKLPPAKVSDGKPKPTMPWKKSDSVYESVGQSASGSKNRYWLLIAAMGVVTLGLCALRP